VNAQGGTRMVVSLLPAAPAGPGPLRSEGAARVAGGATGNRMGVGAGASPSDVAQNGQSGRKHV
jgi:hypothetical protein